MLKATKHLLGVIAMVFLWTACHPFQHLPQESETYFKTELYFGTEKPDGSHVSSEEWKEFLKEIVTPRFRDGFTVLEGYGQWLHESGEVHQEKSKILILLYQEPQPAQVHIEEIRKMYCKQFEQEAVIRVDERVYLDL